MPLRAFRQLFLIAATLIAAFVVLGLSTPGQASAADRYKGPTLKAEQGSFGGDKNVKLTLTNPNKADGVFAESSCTSIMLDGAKALEAFIAFNSNDYVALIKIMATPNAKVGPGASNDLVRPGPNSNSRELKAEDGVYIYLGTCGGIKSLTPGNVGVSMIPVIVPSGIGSLGSALDFGSLALNAGTSSSDLGALLGLLSAS